MGDAIAWVIPQQPSAWGSNLLTRPAPHLTCPILGKCTHFTSFYIVLHRSTSFYIVFTSFSQNFHIIITSFLHHSPPHHFYIISTSFLHNSPTAFGLGFQSLYTGGQYLSGLAFRKVYLSTSSHVAVKTCGTFQKQDFIFFWRGLGGTTKKES